MREFQPGLAISLGSSIDLIGAESPDLPHPLVLKKSHPEAPEAVTARFETVAQILPRLATPHAPTLRASGLDLDQAYLLMDRIPGETLADILRRGALDEKRIVALGIALARALHAIHLQQTVHLHVLPSHVMVRPDGQVVLLSFSLAHHRECPDLLSGEDWLRAAISPWMAPEQLYQVRDDARSDQWALGALMYQMAVGHPPFSGATQPADAGDLEERLWKAPAPLRHLRPDLPAWLQEVIHRCLEVAPSDRYDNCSQIAWALGHPESVELHPERAGVEPAPLWRRFARWLDHQRDPVKALKGLSRDEMQKAPLVVLAIDPEVLDGDLPGRLRDAVRQVVVSNRQAHLACLSVIDGPSSGTPLLSAAAAPRPADPATSPNQRNALQALRLWAKPLAMPAPQLSFHVIEGGDPTQQLLDFAAQNQAALIVIGASHPGYGEVRCDIAMHRVLEQAGCSVFVVRPNAGSLEI